MLLALMRAGHEEAARHAAGYRSSQPRNVIDRKNLKIRFGDAVESLPKL